MIDSWNHNKLVITLHEYIGVRAGGARGGGGGGPPPPPPPPPQILGNSDFLGQQEKIWAKPGFKDVSYFADISIFYFNLKKEPEVGAIIQLHSLEILVA